MNVLIFFLYVLLLLFYNTGAIGVATVEIGEETIIEMEVVLDLIGVIIMVGIDHVHTKGFNGDHFLVL